MKIYENLLNLINQSPIKDQLVTRIAPTPSGFLHLGNIINFYLIWKTTRHFGGKIQLRIDDCDAARSRDEYIEDIFSTLNFLGIDWDIGPKDAQDFKQNFSQNLKTQTYFKQLEKIKDFTYACECSRKELVDYQQYPQFCVDKNLTFKTDHTAIRLKTKGQCSMGDFVIWRKDSLPAYQLVSVIEDHENKINLIVRGEDLLESTQAQLYLSSLLDFRLNEAIIFHHPLLSDQSGLKLSKTKGDLSITQMRNAGLSREEIINQVHLFTGA